MRGGGLIPIHSWVNVIPRVRCRAPNRRSPIPIDTGEINSTGGGLRHMLVLSFAVEGADNCAEVDGVPYVYVRTAQGSMVTPALCVHRGGPLHLATAKSGGTFLVCP